jgi:hypothetical protein
VTAGPCPIRRSQITRLLSLPDQATIQVVPFQAGPHPAKGSFMIFNFDSDVIQAGIFAEGSIGTKGIVEVGKEIDRYEQVWAYLNAKALDVEESATFLRDLLGRIT